MSNEAPVKPRKGLGSAAVALPFMLISGFSMSLLWGLLRIIDYACGYYFEPIKGILVGMLVLPLLLVAICLFLSYAVLTFVLVLRRRVPAVWCVTILILAGLLVLTNRLPNSAVGMARALPRHTSEAELLNFARDAQGISEEFGYDQDLLRQKLKPKYPNLFALSSQRTGIWVFPDAAVALYWHDGPSEAICVMTFTGKREAPFKTTSFHPAKQVFDHVWIYHQL